MQIAVGILTTRGGLQVTPQLSLEAGARPAVCGAANIELADDQQWCLRYRLRLLFTTTDPSRQTRGRPNRNHTKHQELSNWYPRRV